ncbi:MAG TPA: tRNA (adenosine(37)-N6)-threonylcarbamoyltransferase complex transferase subunit TsaD [Patescibacteria group bacterium]
MRILAIETSCDETGAAVVEFDGKKVQLLSNVVASSLSLHAETGGIIPERAAREQIKFIIPVISKALVDAEVSFNRENIPNIDEIAITYGPGLIGSLLVGVETAKTLSYIWDKPLIPVNHLFGHIYANWIEKNSDEPTILPEFPLVALIVSGGHTDLVLMKSHQDVTWIGGTRDDAAGEAYDKIGRLLNLPYPAGPKIEQLAKDGDPNSFKFPRPLLHEGGYDFSFSGLKTAVLREVQKIKSLNDKTVSNICRCMQDAIIEVLVKKTMKAASEYGVKNILLSGGVAANETLGNTFREKIAQNTHQVKFYVPIRKLCTDNAAMIGSAACFKNESMPWEEITANPELYFD